MGEADTAFRPRFAVSDGEANDDLLDLQMHWVMSAMDSVVRCREICSCVASLLAPTLPLSLLTVEMMCDASSHGQT